MQDITLVSETGNWTFAFDGSEEVDLFTVIQLGLLFNSVVAIILIVHKRFYKFRNAIWSGIFFYFAMAYVTFFLETLTCESESCLAYLILIAMDDSKELIFLFNACLMAWEQYLYDNWPHVYRSQVNIAKFFVLQVAFYTAILMLLLLKYWIWSQPF